MTKRIASLLVLLLLALTACEGPAEKAGEQLDAQVQEARQQVKELQSQIADYKQEIVEARQSLQELQKELAAAQTELGQAREQRQEALQSLQPQRHEETSPSPGQQGEPAR